MGQPGDAEQHCQHQHTPTGFHSKRGSAQQQSQACSPADGGGNKNGGGLVQSLRSMYCSAQVAAKTARMHGEITSSGSMREGDA